MTVSQSRIQKMARIACLSAIAYVLMMVEFPIVPVAAYLKLDFSDVPVLFGTLLYGPMTGIVIAAIKVFIHALVYGFSLGELLGSASSLISSLMLLLPFSWAMKLTKLSLKKRYVVGTLLATTALTVVMTILNWLVLTPLYMQLWGWHPTLPIPMLMMVGVLPFNVIKGLLVGGVASLLFIHLQYFINKRQ